MVEMVEIWGALICPDDLVPVVLVVEALLWYKAAGQHQDKGRSHLFTTPYWDEVLKLPWKDKGPWQTPRSMVLAIGSLMFFAEKRK